MASSKNDYREIKERALEVCRDFVRNRCSRSDLDCRYAHPPNYVEVRDGRVIVCFDFTKNRCKRTSPPCKYFHPPDHLLSQASSSRRNDDYYGSKTSGGGGGGGGFGSVDSYYSSNYGLTPYLANALGNYKAALDAAMPWIGGGDQQRSSFRSGGGGSGNGGSFDSRSDKIEVCREFKRSKCNRDECRFAHPPEHIKVGYDNYVTYCMDFVNGRCNRDTCRYFHPPAHLLDRLNRTGSSQGSGKKRPFKSSDGPASADGAPSENSGDDYGSASKKVALDYGYN